MATVTVERTDKLNVLDTAGMRALIAAFNVLVDRPELRVLAAACDLPIATDRARFAMSEVGIGIPS